MQGEDLWKRYCGFIEKDFSEQIEYNENKLKEEMKRWMRTKTAKDILKDKKIEKIEDIPLTEMKDYKILDAFGNAIEKEIAKNPRRKGELWIDYYARISNKVKNVIKDYLPYDFLYPVKTTGTTGKSKWIPHTTEVEKITRRTFMTLTVMACAPEWGKTSLRKGDTILSMAAPIPYSTGYGVYIMSDFLNIFPPPQISDNIKSMGERFRIIMKAIQKGQKIDLIFAYPSILHMLAQALTEPSKLYFEQYRSLPPGIAKIAVYFLYLKEKLKKGESRRASDFIKPKGIITGGFDVKLYIDFIEEQYGVSPTNFYGSTEVGGVMISPPGKPDRLMPLLWVGYWEFMDEKEGNVWKIDELRKGVRYELVASPFGTMFMRYRTGDLFSVVDFRDDGMPIFTFEGRRIEIIDIRNYIRLSANMAQDVLKKAGLTNTDKWAVTKVVDGDEKIMFLMEKTWDLDEKAAAKRIFEAMKMYEDFRNYIEDFKIKRPEEVIVIKYLKKGAFARYAMRKIKKGAPLGQYKPPKVIPPERKDIIDDLIED